MAAIAFRVTCDTSADAIASNDSGRYVVRNRGSVAVYLGGAAVTSSDGFQLDPGESASFDLNGSDDLYGVVASGSAAVHVLKVDS